MKIKRTPFAGQPRATVWVQDPWAAYAAAPMSDTAHVGEYPTHSPVLGPDGEPLQYEPRMAVGFDLLRKA